MTSRRTGVGVTALMAMIGACGAGGERARGGHAPLRSAEELRQAEVATCERARAAGKPVLVEFTASWCGDCQRLTRVRGQAPLNGELSRWQVLAIDVGDGFRHPDHMRAFHVREIARWAALAPPARCQVPMKHWRRGPALTIGKASRGKAAPARLAAFLASARAGLASSR